MGEYESEFDNLDPEPDLGQQQAPPQQEPQADPAAARMDALERGLYQLAHLYMQDQEGYEEPQPQEVPELRLRVNPQTGAWEPYQEQQEPQQPDVNQLVEQALAPHMPRLEQFERAEGEHRINQAFETIAGNLAQHNNGEEVKFSRATARAHAEYLASSGQAPTFEDAVKAGVAHALLERKQIEEELRGANQDHLKALAEHRPEPGAGGNASPRAETPTGQDAYDRVKDQFFSERRGMRVS